MRRSVLRRFFSVVGIVAILAIVGGSVFLYVENRALKRDVSDSDKVKAAHASLLKKAVVPKEEPVLYATVVDPEVLKGEVFYRFAEKDDIVLLYQNARLAVLYRQLSGKIVSIITIPDSDMVELTSPSSTDKPE